MQDRKQERREFIDRLGRAHVMQRLRLGSPSAITNAIRLGFPARWLPVIEEMCRDAGIECPRELFNVCRTADGEVAA